MECGMRESYRYRIVCVLVLLATVAVVMTSCVSTKGGSTSHSTLHTPRSSLSFNDSQRLKYFYYEAMKLQEQGKFAAAFDLLKHCETIDPQAAEVYYAQAAYYAELNNDTMALACMKKAADLNPAKSWPRASSSPPRS